MKCSTCKDTGIICGCREPTRHWCNKLRCRGRTCPTCDGNSEPMVVDIVIGLDEVLISANRTDEN